MREAIRAALAADPTLLATLIGGIHAATEISRQATAAAFAADGELLPCVLVTVEQEAHHGPYRAETLSARTYIVIYVYQRRGFSSIDAALTRIRTLLHRQKLGPATWQIDWAGDSGDLQDEGLGCAMRFSRYVCTRAL